MAGAQHAMMAAVRTMSEISAEHGATPHSNADSRIPVKGFCGWCGKDGAMSKCSRCLLAYFCNSDCQRAAWKSHKKVCEELSLLAKNKRTLEDGTKVKTTFIGISGENKIRVQTEIKAKKPSSGPPIVPSRLFNC